MAYVDAKIKPQFHTLSNELQKEILKKDVKLYTLNDLIRCLETIVSDN